LYIDIKKKMTANLAKTSTNANGNITIGHYILGN
jgi:hypothetical protein